MDDQFDNRDNRTNDVRAASSESMSEQKREELIRRESVKVDEAAEYLTHAPHTSDPLRDVPFERVRTGRPTDPHWVRRAVLVGVGAFLLVGGGVFMIGYTSLKKQLKSDITLGLYELQTSLEANGSLSNPAELQQGFEALRSRFEERSSDPWVGFFTLFTKGAGLYQGFQKITGSFSELFRDVALLVNTGPALSFHGKGSELIGRIESIRAVLQDIEEGSSVFSSSSSEFADAAVTPTFYLPLKLDANRFGKFLDALLPWLKNSETHHLALFLGNSSEMRPGGGFIGSYVDVSIRGGNIEALGVHDINDADRLLGAHIVPPKPLQAIASTWRAADANWFFDFSDSAKTVLSLLERSGLYRASSTVFEGAIAISPKVASDILAVTGPVELPALKRTITKDNFLPEIQKDIQTNRAEKASYPKQILRELTPLVVEKLLSIGEAPKKELFKAFGAWTKEKDLVFYFKNPEFQKFFDVYELTGTVFKQDSRFNGDYLAVVPANIGGGKTDLFIRQTITFQSQIGEDGVVKDHLEVARTHQGNTAKYSWYKVPNESYFKIFTPPGASLDNTSGGFMKKIMPKVNYAKAGYETDPLVAEVESGLEESLRFSGVDVFTESGKNVFGTWTKVSSGKTVKLLFDYSYRLFEKVADGMKYRFVFEKQAASTADYVFEISAPVGYVWNEGNLPVYEYKSVNPPGRLIVTLALRKL